nr:hypothetical protein [Tanacetum cinerariifolium]
KFKRVYVCLGPLKDGFKAAKRDLLGLDGCFLSGSYHGWILTAVGGIIPAIAESFPNAEHRFCLKHIYDNMKLSWRGQLYKEMYGDVQHPILSRGRAHCDVLLNNMCEVFNRQLVDGRDKPIITCLEFIREYLMKRIVNVQKVISKSDVPLTPNATKVFNIIMKEAGQMKIDWNGGDLYQATTPLGDQCVVNMRTKECSCRKWELTGIPCKHALTVIWDMDGNEEETAIPESYCHQVHWHSTWKDMYRFKAT